MATMEDENELPKIGLSFSSKGAVEKFIRSYEDKAMAVFTIKDSKCLPKTNELRNTLYWYEVNFCCKHGGASYRNDGNAQRKTRYTI